MTYTFDQGHQFIDGAWRVGGGAGRDRVNPATGEVA